MTNASRTLLASRALNELHVIQQQTHDANYSQRDAASTFHALTLSPLRDDSTQKPSDYAQFLVNDLKPAYEKSAYDGVNMHYALDYQHKTHGHPHNECNLYQPFSGMTAALRMLHSNTNGYQRKSAQG
jgi:hypothetical protein